MAAWEQLAASIASRYSDYETIRIEPVDYRGHEAAVWEYRSTTSGGTDLHAVNLGMRVGAHGYALNFVTPAGQWEALRPVFDSAAASFAPVP